MGGCRREEPLQMFLSKKPGVESLLEVRRRLWPECGLDMRGGHPARLQAAPRFLTSLS